MHLSAVTVCDMNIWPARLMLSTCRLHDLHLSHGGQRREREREGGGGGKGVCFYFIKDTTLVH